MAKRKSREGAQGGETRPKTGRAAPLGANAREAIGEAIRQESRRAGRKRRRKRAGARPRSGAAARRARKPAPKHASAPKAAQAPPRRCRGSTAHGGRSTKPCRRRPRRWTWTATARPRGPAAPRSPRQLRERTRAWHRHHRRRRRRRCRGRLLHRRRSARRRQPDARSGHRRRHRQGAGRRIPGQRGAEGERQGHRARQAPLGAGPGLVGGLQGQEVEAGELRLEVAGAERV